jgi:hypothetical protein
MGQFHRRDEFLAPKPGTTFSFTLRLVLLPGLPLSPSLWLPDSGLLPLLLALVWPSRRHAGGISSGDSIYTQRRRTRREKKDNILAIVSQTGSP